MHGRTIPEAIPRNAKVSDRLAIPARSGAVWLSEGPRRVGDVEGSLPQHDRRQAAAPARPRGSGSSTESPRIVVFDCETTGTDRTNDQVIELCIQAGLGLDRDEVPDSRVWRIKPAAPIHPGAHAVHGISIADLDECPSFAEVADEIADAFADADIIVGYNLAFDIDMLLAEYARIGRPAPDFASKKIIDAFRLWQQCEPRSLMHAHQRFVGAEFAAAHTASADVAATGRVLAGMLKHFELEGQDWEAIALRSDPLRSASWVGPSRHLRWDGDVIVLAAYGAGGKHANAAIHELAAGPDRAFLEAMVAAELPPHVHDVCRMALELPADAFLAWARDRFGQPAPTVQPPFARTPQ